MPFTITIHPAQAFCTCVTFTVTLLRLQFISQIRSYFPNFHAQVYNVMIVVFILPVLFIYLFIYL